MNTRERVAKDLVEEMLATVIENQNQLIELYGPPPIAPMDMWEEYDRKQAQRLQAENEALTWLLSLIQGEPVVWLPPERLPVIRGEKPDPRRKTSGQPWGWSQVSHHQRRNRNGESYIPLYLSATETSRDRKAVREKVDRIEEGVRDFRELFNSGDHNTRTLAWVWHQVNELQVMLLEADDEK